MFSMYPLLPLIVRLPSLGVMYAFLYSSFCTGPVNRNSSSNMRFFLETVPKPQILLISYFLPHVVYQESSSQTPLRPSRRGKPVKPTSSDLELNSIINNPKISPRSSSTSPGPTPAGVSGKVNLWLPEEDNHLQQEIKLNKTSAAPDNLASEVKFSSFDDDYEYEDDFEPEVIYFFLFFSSIIFQLLHSRPREVRSHRS